MFMRGNVFSNLFQSINQYIIPTSPDGRSRQNLSGQFFALKNSWWIWAWDSSNSCYQYPRRRAILFFFPQVIGLCFFGQKGGWGHSYFLKFSLKVKISFDIRVAFFCQLMLLFLYLLLTEKKQHIEKISNFSLCWTHFEGFPPKKKKTSPNPTPVSEWSSAGRCCGEETFGVKKRQSWRDTKLGTEVAGGRTWWMSWSLEHMGGLESGSKMSFFLERSS